MRLHHQPRSRSTRVLWLLEEIGEPFDLTVISREDKQTPAYRSLHPLGRSPVAETGDGPVFESCAIMLHLADLHPEAGLIGPLGSYERALQYQWSFFAMTELEGALMEVARQVWKEDGEPDADAVAAATARFDAAAAVVGEAVADHEFLVGDRFSVADVIVGSVVGFARTGGITPLPDSVVPYVDRLEARPARARALAVALPA